MSSFDRPHYLYLFDLRGSEKKRLAYGSSPQDALEVLRLRSTDEEMKQIVVDSFERIKQRDLQHYIDKLG